MALEHDDLLAEARKLARKKDFVHLARKLLEVSKKKKYYRAQGYRDFDALIKDIFQSQRGGTARSTAYLYIQVLRRLHMLSDDELNRIGISKARYLVWVTPPGQAPAGEWLEKAKKLPYAQFKIEVERALRRNRRSQEYGEALDPSFRGLRNAPINEQGVVYLFALVSKDLKFTVEKVQRSYPDCIAREPWPGRPHKMREVFIEFEFRSSDFRHPPEGCDIIVCWEHDWPECPVKRVIELKSEIEKLPRA